MAVSLTTPAMPPSHLLLVTKDEPGWVLSSLPVIGFWVQTESLHPSTIVWGICCFKTVFIPSLFLWNSKHERSLILFLLCYQKKRCFLCSWVRKIGCQPTPNPDSPPDNYWHLSRAAFNWANIWKEQNLYVTGLGKECHLKFIAEALP